MLTLDTTTPWGKIGAIGMIEGERYYWMVDKSCGVAMIPASVVEATVHSMESKSNKQKGE